MKIKKSVLFFDIDNTCYNGFTPLELAIDECKNGLILRSDLAILQKDMDDLKNGILSYEELIANYIKHLLQITKGKKRSDFSKNAEKFLYKKQK